MPSDKTPTSYRFDEDVRAILKELSASTHMSQTALIEMAVRAMKRAGVPATMELAAAPPAATKGRKR